MCVNPIKVNIQYKDMSTEACKKRSDKGLPVNKFYGYVPCGKCYECLCARRTAWTLRLKNEAQNSNKTVFVTLTYNDEHCDGELHKDHAKKALKYIRDHHHLQFKYYLIGEYGTTTYRPHYHALIFFKENYDIDLISDVINKAWSIKENVKGKYTYTPIGFVSMSEALPQQIGYITHYHTRPKVNGDKQKAFAMSSQGLGIHLLTDEILKYLEQSPDYYIRTLEGDKFLLPSYYRKKFNIDKDIIATKKHYLIKKRSEFEYYLGLNTNEQLRYRLSKVEASNHKKKLYNKQVKFNTI